MEDSYAQGTVVLVLATGYWVSTARLVMALAELGCAVDLAAPANHPALTTGTVRKSYRYDPLRPARSLRSAIAAAKPSTVIAADEVMVQHLEDLWWTAETNKTPEGEALQRLIKRSLGGRVVLEAARSRMTLLDVAQQQGIATPRTISVPAPERLEAVIAQLGLPLILKADATSGGRGVKVATTAAEAHAAWKSLHEPPSLPRAVVRGLMRKEWNHLRRSARKKTREVSAQRFVQGPERTGMVACREGEVLAAVCLEVVRTWCERGPSSVVRVIRDEAMETAMCRVAGQLRMSGFAGFDFIVETTTGRPLLIEMNPRPTQLVHLPLGAGKDLVAAYARGVLGLHGVEDRAAATGGDLIALFPQEMQRDAESEFLQTAFHDIPWKTPALVERALAGSPKPTLRKHTGGGEGARAPQRNPMLAISEQRTMS